MTYHYYLFCPKCNQRSPDAVFVTFNGSLRKDDYGMGGRSECVRTGEWLEEHEHHAFGELILLHQNDPRSYEDQYDPLKFPKEKE